MGRRAVWREAGRGLGMSEGMRDFLSASEVLAALADLGIVDPDCDRTVTTCVLPAAPLLP